MAHLPPAKMAVVGRTGVLVALLIYSLILNILNASKNTVFNQSTEEYFSFNEKPMHKSFTYGNYMDSGRKHFGFGKEIIYTCGWIQSPYIGRKTKAWGRSKHQNSDNLIISLCLSLSGDTPVSWHQYRAWGKHGQEWRPQ